MTSQNFITFNNFCEMKLKKKLLNVITFIGLFFAYKKYIYSILCYNVCI